MQSNRRLSSLTFSLWVLAVICVCGWSQTLSKVSATPMPAFQEPQPQAQQPDQSKAGEGKTMTFTGTVVKQGEGFVLRDSSGAVYQLDNASRAQQFEGKTVTVTGKLDPETKTIHVASIEGA